VVPKIQAIKVENMKKVRLSMEIEEFFVFSTLMVLIFESTRISETLFTSFERPNQW